MGEKVVNGEKEGEAENGLKNVSVTENMVSHTPSEVSLPEGLPIDGAEDMAPYRLRQVASKTVVAFHSQDPANPVNWSEVYIYTLLLKNIAVLLTQKKKFFILAAGVLNVLNSTLSSSLPSGAMPYIAEEFNIKSEAQLVLPISLFLVGYVFGPIFCGPLSESYGRKMIMIIGFVAFIIFTLACAVCKTYASLLVFRFFLGIVASAPIAIVGGLFADIYDDPRERGRVMSYFMAATIVGPVAGPSITGSVSGALGWRWSFWIGLIVAGLTLPFVILMPETYAPVLLQRRARALRKKTGNNKIVALLDLEKKGIKATLTVTLTRPIRLIINESIVLFSCLYLSLVYGIFFLYFQTYPIVFKGIYHMSDGVAGLMYLPIGFGAFLSCGIFLWWDSFLHKAKLRGASWSASEEYRRLPLACVGGPLYVISLLWLGWTASPDIHWVVPMLSGITFGTGFMLIFMAILNYLSDAYETFSASAQSAASCCRSLFGAGLPIAAGPMYRKLGVDWGCSLLAFLSLAMTIIPFAFIKYGSYIRANSKFCQQVQQMKEDRIREEEEEGREASRISQGNDIEKGESLSNAG